MRNPARPQPGSLSPQADISRLLGNALLLPLAAMFSGCGGGESHVPPPVAAPAEFRFDDATIAHSREPAFDPFRAQLRAFRALTREAAELQRKSRDRTISDPERARLAEVNAGIAQELTLINEMMADPRADELDRRAMRYLFGASDAELDTPAR